jgi:hypothetical protein
MHRAINLIIALATCCFGLWGFVYFYFIAWNGWMAMATGVMGVAGLYWLYMNPGRTTQGAIGPNPTKPRPYLVTFRAARFVQRQDGNFGLIG